MTDAAKKDAPAVSRVRIGVATHVTPKFSLVGNEALQDLLLVIDECIEAGEFKIIIDFDAVQTIDSVALSALMDLQDRLLKMGGWAKITGHNNIIGEIAEITGISDYISFLDGNGQQEQKETSDIKPGPGSRLGDILVARGLIAQSKIDEALKLQDRLGKRMGSIIIDKGWVDENDVLRALSEQLGVPFVRLRPGLFDPVAAATLDTAIARRLCVMPLFRVRSVLYLATAKPQDMPTFDEVSERLQCEVRPVLARREDIQKLLNESLGIGEIQFDMVGDVDEDFEVVENLQLDDFSTIDEVAAGSPVVNLVNSIIQRAVHDGASDIHLEPFRVHSRIRFRIDGLLYEFTAPRIELHPALVSRLKVMANLDIAERRLPQDGRIQVHTQGRSVDLRFSSLPGLFGEKVVLRILDKNQAILDINKLNLSTGNLSLFKTLLDANNGLILVTGPTGSGKTTSLYAALNYLKSIEKNIVTIEDPVEYQLDIINQNEVRDGIGLSFAKILKHVLRQDPNIVMVGEIRERETAEIAVQAALTGHLVLSTLHTNDAVGAVTRLMDMGVEPYLLSSALLGVVGQRLVRTICPACKYEILAPPELVAQHGWQSEGDVRLAKGKGCEECYDSGHKGRMGIHEILKTDPDLQKLIISNPSRDELTDYLDGRGFHNLFKDGLALFLSGERQSKKSRASRASRQEPVAIQFDKEQFDETREAPGSSGLKLNLPGRNKRAGASDRMFFTEQLALLLETGESLFGALTAIVAQTENPEMSAIVQKIALDISEGRSFGAALAEHDHIFSSTYVNLIAASETGGFMHEVLEQLLDMEEKREQLRTTLVSAATYPLFLIAFSVAVVVFVLIVVFPKFGDMFQSIHDQLPMSTKALMAASNVMREYWYLLLGGIGAMSFAARRWLASDTGTARVDYLKLHAPGIRDIFTQVYLVQSLQVLSLSLNNGVSVMESLEACRDVVKNSHFRGLISGMEESVQAGAGVAAGLADSTFLPDLAKHMIATGEQTGNLGKVAGRISVYYEAQLAKKLDKVSKLAEPLMLLIMGVVVGVLVSSLILPIFKLSRAVS